MRKHLLLFFLALLFIISCKESKSDSSIIAKDKMVLILSDIHLVDGSMLIHGANDSLYKYGTKRYSLVFKKHDIDSATFKKSLKYYSGEPKEMMEIYDSIAKLLTKKNDSLTKIQANQLKIETKRSEAKRKAEQKRKTDSVQRDSAKAAKIIKLKLKRKALL